MGWPVLGGAWAADAAVGGLVVLAAGSLAVKAGRQPVRRIRLALLTLLGAATVPWLGALPVVPRLSLGIVHPAEDPRPIEPGKPAASPPVGLRPPPGPAPGVLENDGRAVVSTAAPKAGREASRDAEPAPATWSFPPTGVIAAVAYGLGATGLAAWWLLGQIAFRRVVRAARPAPAEVREALLGIAGAGGERVRLLVSDRIALPFTDTWLRPVILLPPSLCDGREPEALRYALAHEWSHVERRDAWAWRLAGLSGLVLFYQPLFWRLRRELRICQDFLADDRAAAAGSSEDYAAFLVHLARIHGPGPSWPALGIGDRQSNLQRRVVMLMQAREPLDRRCRPGWTLGVSAMTAAVVTAASGVRLEAVPPANGAPAVQDAPKAPAPAGETLHYKGVVKDKDTGKPIAGATVVVRRSVLSDVANRVLEESHHTTAADGSYSFTIPPDQAAQPRLYIELDVEHPDYATRAGFGYALGMIRKNEGLGERPFFESVELRPAQPVFGKVESPDGAPAGGVELLTYSQTDKLSREQFEYGSFARAKTADDGTFRLPVTTPGRAILWILPKAHAPEMHVLADGRRGDLGAFRLKPGVKLTGRALDAQGKPRAGLLLAARRERRGLAEADAEALGRMTVSDAIQRTAETDAEGRFTFGPLPPGSYEVKPTDYEPGEGRSQGWSRREIPGTYMPVEVAIKDGESPEPLEIRETPHVVVEGSWVDSKGKPRSGWNSTLFGRIGDKSWFTQTAPDDQGRFSAKVPLGLKDVKMDVILNEHAAARHRIGKDAPLVEGRNINLGTLDHDVKGIEIVRYVAPVIVINAMTNDGKQVEGFKAVVKYAGEGPVVDLSGGRKVTEAIQDEQNDGRFRTTQLLPDREVKVTVTADGFAPAEKTMTLPEGKVVEATLVMQRK